MNKFDLEVSIVTPSFNSVSTLERTLRSVHGQTYKSIEHIVIDGGSTDGTREILEKHDRWIANWVSEPDMGIAHAFDKGITLASGELIGIVNADDWLEPEAVENVVECYLENSRPDVIFGNLYFPELRRVQRGDPDFSRKIKYFMPTLNHPTCFVSRRAYKKWGVFDKELKIAMDFELLRRFYLKGAAFHHLDKTLSNMTLGGVSNRNLVRRYREILRIAGFNPITLAHIAKNLASNLYRDHFLLNKSRRS